MDKLKTISVKIDPKTLEQIDAFVGDHKYWKRNTVINSILHVVMKFASKDDVYDMVRLNWWEDDYIVQIVKKEIK